MRFLNIKPFVIFFLLACTSHLTGAQKLPEVLVQTDGAKDNYGEVRITVSKEMMDYIQYRNEDPTFLKLILKVFSGNEIPTEKSIPAISGHHYLDDRSIIFKPKYPPPPGFVITIYFRASMLSEDNDILSDDITRSVTFPESTTEPSTFVDHIYPTSNQIPSNVLRFYIHFSQAMSHDNPYDYISLENSSDHKPIEDAFVVIREGLWDSSRKRLTLLIHPGRIKRGVGPNQTIGPVTRNGQQYTLKVNKDWRDINGNPLTEEHTKSFMAVDPIRNAVNSEHLELELIRSEQNSIAKIIFDRIMDNALMYRMIELRNENGSRVKGEIIVSDHERMWQFNISGTDVNEKFIVHIDKRLEDISGNNFYSEFDVEGQSNEGSGKADHAKIQLTIAVK